jgi:hypothetical protein
LDALITEVGAKREKFLAFYGIKKLDDLPARDWDAAIAELKRRRK